MRNPWHTAARRRVVAGLMLILLCVQTLGFVHRIVHAPMAAPTASASVDEVAEVGSRPLGLTALFAAHQDDESGCRLFDGIGHQLFVLPAALLALPLLPTAGPLRLQAGEFIARHAAPFEARGPPSFR